MSAQFATLVQTARKRRCMTQRDLAEQIGVTPQYINDLERGRRVPQSCPPWLDKMATALDVPADVLCFRLGFLPPDVLAYEGATAEGIVEAFKALRGVLREDEIWR